MRVRVICVGEALIDLVATSTGALKDAGGFVRAPGGAPFNVAVMVARMGSSIGFIGRVGRDPFGEFLRETLEHHGVDTAYLVSCPARTGLAFVSITDDGERDFVFYRNPGADELLEPADLDLDYVAGADVFHFGSVSLSSEQSRAAVLHGVAAAARSGLMVSFDPNVRLSLWPSADEARHWCLKAAERADLLKLSREEALFLSGQSTIELAAEELAGDGARAVIVTLGPDGCYYHVGSNRGHVPGFAVDTVDSTGAGDAFMGVLLASLLDRDINELDERELRELLQSCNAGGALTTTARGAVSAQPDPDRIRSLVE